MSPDRAATAAALRPLAESDLMLVLGWRNDPSIRSRMFTQDLISFPEHQAWFHRVAADPNRSAFLVVRDDVAIGFVQFNVEPLPGSCEWGFYKDPDAPPGTGLSIGRAALDYAFQDMRWECVRGRTLPDNTASQRLHLRLGFRQVSQERGGITFAITRTEWLTGREVVQHD
jgi:UDP-4-amino-4,6-dideoxy-N-acetyl-beta-L-altrosamine N-acetyltransferase